MPINLMQDRFPVKAFININSYIDVGTLETISNDVETLPASKLFAVVHISKYLT